MAELLTDADTLSLICDHLSERTATLFLGAGINGGVRNAKGQDFPLAQGLARWIACDLLNAPELGLPLDQIAEIARHRVGPEALNRYLFDTFTAFNPGAAHLSLVQLPWDVIYSTNYDTLVEQASAASFLNTPGSIRPVFSLRQDIDAFSEEDVPYYKLHGSVDRANTEEGRLILTAADYQDYLRLRKPLFRRLERDLTRRTFVFVGYSLTDSNFLEIIEDCRQELGYRPLPLSFAVRRKFQPVEEAYWRDKYNIQLIRNDSESFLGELKETWIAQDRTIVPLEERRARVYLQVDRDTQFPKVAESYYRVRPADCTSPSQPELFFKGAEPTWGDIRDDIPPHRDVYWSLFDAMLDELADPTLAPTTYLVTGAAGTGKTTLIWSFVYDLASQFANDVQVLIHIPSTPLEVRHLIPLIDQRRPQRLVLVVRHAAEVARNLETFLADARQHKMPLTLILEERRNQWAMASTFTRHRIAPVEFELGSLSEGEVDDILTALEQFGALGKLKGMPRRYQIEHFEGLAHKELLVALRELTSGTSFDEIVRDEYRKIPSAIARRAYAYAAAVGQFDLAVRYETLMRLLQIDFAQLALEVFQPAQGILISGEEIGSSRQSAGYRVGVRHPVIASIIFALVAPDDDSKMEIINGLLTHIDPGHIEDRRLLHQITHRRRLVETIASPEKRRAIYQRLEEMLPDDPFVLQQRSILERDLDNLEESVNYGRRALKMRPENPALQNTLGLALEHLARDLTDPLRRQVLLSEAETLFNRGIKRDPSNPFAYQGKFYIIRQSIDRECDSYKKSLLRAQAVSLLNEAYEATNEDGIIAQHLAQQKQELGTAEEAIAILQRAISTSPEDTTLRDLLIRFEVERSNHDYALEVALEGTRYDPTSWKLQRHIARLLRTKAAALDSVRGHYDAAIRHRKGDVKLLVELGAYLFQNRLVGDANTVFEEAKNLSISVDEKKRFRETWTDCTGNAVEFNGTVKHIGGAVAWVMAVPENFEAMFWRNNSRLGNLSVGQSVQFVVKYNAYGPYAFIEM